MDEIQLLLGTIESFLPALPGYLQAQATHPAAVAIGAAAVVIFALLLFRSQRKRKRAPRVGLLNRYPWPAHEAKAANADGQDGPKKVSQFLLDDDDHELAPGTLHDRVGQLISSAGTPGSSRSSTAGIWKAASWIWMTSRTSSPPFRKPNPTVRSILFCTHQVGQALPAVRSPER
jgi:hypothetical protein